MVEHKIIKYLIDLCQVEEIHKNLKETEEIVEKAMQDDTEKIHNI
jgi:hypothetical protein